MRCETTSSVTECAPRARSGDVHVAHVVVSLVVDAVVGLTLGLIAHFVIVVFVVAILQRIFCIWRYTLHIIAVSCCCRRTFSCWMATAMSSCSSGVDMVVHARGPPAVRFKYPRSIRAAIAATDPPFPGALTAPPDSRETTRFTVPVFREETITAPLPCYECMQTDVPYTHTCFPLGERAAGSYDSCSCAL